MSSNRLELTITSFPDEASVFRAVELIYDSRDQNLAASLSITPYTIGRTFEPERAAQLGREFRQLKIGFRFRQAGTETVFDEYDPSKPTVSRSKENAPEEKAQVETKTSRTPLLKYGSIGGGGLLIVIALSALFLNETQIREPSPEERQAVSQAALEKEDALATLSRLKNRVEVQFQGKLFWSKAERGMGLDFRDSVRTFDASVATVRYRDGSTVTAKPNTLLVVGEEEGFNRELSLEDGGLRTQIPYSAQERSIEIQTDDGVLRMKSPQVGAETRVETSLQGGKLRVAVAEGEAVLEVKDPDSGKSQTEPIASNEQIQLTEGQRLVRQPYEPPRIQIQVPRPDAIVEVDPNGDNPIRFEWIAVPNATSYEWQVSADPQFTQVLFEQTVSEPQLRLAYLDLGVVFWRVTTEVDGTYFASKTQRLHVENNDD